MELVLEISEDSGVGEKRKFLQRRGPTSTCNSISKLGATFCVPADILRRFRNLWILEEQLGQTAWQPLSRAERLGHRLPVD